VSGYTSSPLCFHGLHISLLVVFEASQITLNNQTNCSRYFCKSNFLPWDVLFNLFRYIQMVNWSVEDETKEGRLTKVNVENRTQRNGGLL
jgi:hypothetical protein